MPWSLPEGPLSLGESRRRGGGGGAGEGEASWVKVPGKVACCPPPCLGELRLGAPRSHFFAPGRRRRARGGSWRITVGRKIAGRFSRPSGLVESRAVEE